MDENVGRLIEKAPSPSHDIEIPRASAKSPINGARVNVLVGSRGTCCASRNAAHLYLACHNAMRSSSLNSPRAPRIARATPSLSGGCLNNTLTLANAAAAVASAYTLGATVCNAADAHVVINDARIALRATPGGSTTHFGNHSTLYDVSVSIDFATATPTHSAAPTRLARLAVSGKATERQIVAPTACASGSILFHNSRSALRPNGDGTDDGDLLSSSSSSTSTSSSTTSSHPLNSTTLNVASGRRRLLDAPNRIGILTLVPCVIKTRSRPPRDATNVHDDDDPLVVVSLISGARTSASKQTRTSCVKMVIDDASSSLFLILVVSSSKRRPDVDGDDDDDDDDDDDARVNTPPNIDDAIRRRHRMNGWN
jgi:hypothetical protein